MLQRLLLALHSGYMPALGASIGFASMRDFDDEHDEPSVLDFVDDSIDALPDPIAFLTGQLFAAWRSRIVRQRPDTLQDTFDVLFR